MKYQIKKSVFLFLIILNTTIYSQNKQLLVEYDYFNHFFSNRETLVVKRDSVLYFNEKADINFDSNVKETEDKNYHITPNFKVPRRNNYSKLNGLVFNLEIPKQGSKNGTFIYVKDSIQNFNWKIYNDETKIIGTYTCKKATTTFRGRNYIAYFTESIPISSGPFKFCQLPGLILQIENTESDAKHIWKATKILYPFETKELKNKINFAYNIKRLPVENYKKFILDNENQKEDSSISQSKLPKGVIITETKTVRMGSEIKYEWE